MGKFPKKFNNLLSIFMIFSILLTPTYSVFANENDNYQGVTFLELTEDHMVYTFVENEKTYKFDEYIETTNTDKNITSFLSVLEDNKFVLIDQFYTTLDVESLKQETQYNNFNISNYITNEDINYLNLDIEPQSSNWQYWSGPNYLEKRISGSLTIAIISAAISSLAPHIAARTISSIASVYFASRHKDIYLSVYSYKDTNSPQLRPIFKYITFFYYDSARTNELAGSPNITIIDSSIS